jgi:hypothetical protein
MNSFYTTPSYFFTIHNKFFPPTYILVFLVVSFLLDFPPRILYAFLFTHTRAAYPAYLTLLDLIVPITSGEKYKL